MTFLILSFCTYITASPGSPICKSIRIPTDAKECPSRAAFYNDNKKFPIPRTYLGDKPKDEMALTKPAYCAEEKGTAI